MKRADISRKLVQKERKRREERTRALAAFIDENLNKFCKQFKRTRAELARALDRHQKNIAYSHLCVSRSACSVVLESFRRDNLPGLVVCLRLEARDYDALLVWSETFINSAFGTTDQPNRSELGQSEYETPITRALACDSAEIALQMFESFDWQRSQGYMEQVWKYFHGRLPKSQEPIFPLVVSCLSQYASLNNHYNRLKDSQAVTHHLMFALQNEIRGSLKIDAANAIAAAYIGAGITARLLNPMQSKLAVRHSRTASSFLEERFKFAKHNEESRHQLIAAWRDQAKPLCFASLTSPRSFHQTTSSQALYAIDRALAWCGGTRPRDENQQDWLFTTLTQIECLASQGQRDQVLKTYDDIHCYSWTEDALSSQEQSPIASKVAMTKLAVAYYQHGFTQVEEEADKILEVLDAVNYANRRSRILAIKEAALQRNDLELRKLFVF